MGEKRHKRIVINFDAQQPGHVKAKGRRRRRGLRILGLVFVLVGIFALLAGAGAFLWWQNYRTTPAYSLALLIDGLQRSDQAVFQEVVDLDKVIENLARQATENATGRYGAAFSDAARSQVSEALPRVRARAAQQARVAVAEQMRTLSEKVGSRPFLVIATTLPYLVNITTEGNTAKAATVVGQRNYELTLERAGERWKVVAIKDDALIQRIADQLIQELPAIGTEPGRGPMEPPGSPGRRRRSRTR